MVKKNALQLIVLMGLLLASVVTMPVQAAKKPPVVSWLFVVSAGTGTIKPIGADKYVVEMNLPDIHNQAIQYSDRPARIVKAISIAELKAHFIQSGDKYFVDPPNVVFSTVEQRPVIAEMLQLSIKKNKLLTTLKFLSGNLDKLAQSKARLRKIVLAIDGSLGILNAP